MEIGPFGWLVVLLGVTAGLSATPRTASATPEHSRAALASNGASPFRGGRPEHGGGWPFGVEQTQDIAGGRPAGSGNPPVSKWPWIAFLHVDLPEPATSYHICGGALIDSRHVLTAAHCYDKHRYLYGGYSLRDLRVRLGEFDLWSSTDGNHTDYKVQAVWQHPRYREWQDASLNHDIALWRLRKEVKFSAGVCTIPLPDGPTGDLAGGNMTFAGWGHIHWNNRSASPYLKELDVTGVSEDECSNKWAHGAPKNKSALEFPGGFMMDKKICIEPKKGGQGECGGDSGNPVVEYGKFRVVGVISAGYGKCGSPKVPTLSTRVSAYLGWIQRTVNRTAGVKTQHCKNTFLHAG